MSELEQEKILVFTPSRKIGGKRVVCYDDRYIVKLAAETDGVIVSNDTYRDLYAESMDFRKTIDERLLMYSFVNDRLLSSCSLYCLECRTRVNTFFILRFFCVHRDFVIAILSQLVCVTWRTVAASGV